LKYIFIIISNTQFEKMPAEMPSKVSPEVQAKYIEAIVECAAKYRNDHPIPNSPFNDLKEAPGFETVAVRGFITITSNHSTTENFHSNVMKLFMAWPFCTVEGLAVMNALLE
jgi:hypothetical protein